LEALLKVQPREETLRIRNEQPQPFDSRFAQLQPQALALESFGRGRQMFDLHSDRVKGKL